MALNFYLGSLFAVAMVILVALAMISVIGYIIYWYIRNSRSPTVRIRAIVIRRRAMPWEFGIGIIHAVVAMGSSLLARVPRTTRRHHKRTARPDAYEPILEQGADYYVTFNVNGTELELRVPGSAYLIAEEGTEGMLVFKGEQFKQFIPMPSQQPPKPDVSTPTQKQADRWSVIDPY